MAHQINPVACRKPFDPSEWTFTQTGDRWRTGDQCRSRRRIVKLTSKRREELEELEQQQNHPEQQPAQPHQLPACPRCRKAFDHLDWTCTPTGDRWRTCDQCIIGKRIVPQQQPVQLHQPLQNTTAFNQLEQQSSIHLRDSIYSTDSTWKSQTQLNSTPMQRRRRRSSSTLSSYSPSALDSTPPIWQRRRTIQSQTQHATINHLLKDFAQELSNLCINECSICEEARVGMKIKIVDGSSICERCLREKANKSWLGIHKFSVQNEMSPGDIPQVLLGEGKLSPIEAMMLALVHPVIGYVYLLRAQVRIPVEARS
ncbi:hypothetical protein L211DRAFT_866121 [Terfezia boudieri ATCC MYA-4762]|uniref:Uncharacterized protein n=1 Tax=Terfezia boudieri ATCC MYA-4762 TaxID=1051890 RepID=A0A3N4LWI5_9PEZI|nr:hypothetical protein L211DRAFT_866121 [Terfezia boudieri ATCC MYA-4762]